MRIKIDLSPGQEPITRVRIQSMITRRPRRMKLSDEWPEPLHEPSSEDKDWCLFLPFCETFKNVFEAMCLSVNHVGLRKNEEGRGYTYIRDVKEKPKNLDKVRDWLEIVGSYVTVRDCLSLSFALDYDRECGNPNKPQTKIGKLRSVAKTYDREPTEDTYKAADNLASECLEFLKNVECYNYSTCVIAMPPSKPGERYNLPAHLAKMVAEGLDKPNLSSAVETIKERPALKEVEIAKKLEAIEGTIRVNSDKLKGQTVLLLDDLYQSGITMNYVAMLLLEAGADKVFGLACEKTCSNDDNVSRGKR